MQKLFFLVTFAALCGFGILADPPAKALAQGQPGERVLSEDSVLRNFHTVDLGKADVKLYRSASPVRDLVKGKPLAVEDPVVMAQAGRVMEHLKSLGIRTIVSLEVPATAGKANEEAVSVAVETCAARAAGITFLAHPLLNGSLKDMAPEAVLQWLQSVEKDLYASAKNGGVLFHCAAGHDRTGLVAAYLRITVDHWPVARAIAEMRSMGHNWVHFSSNGGRSSWHEAFLMTEFPPPATK